MHFGTKRQAESTAIPLQSVVVCIDCEPITDSESVECPLCGRSSLVAISQMLGTALPLLKVSDVEQDEAAVRFDLEFSIEVEQMELKDLNAAIQHITSLIGERLVRGRARCHINVAPVIGKCRTDGDAA